MRHFLFTLALIPNLLVCACATNRAAPSTAARAADPRTVTLVDGRTGRELGWSELITRAAAADAVFIGETHSPGPDQAFHGPFFADLLAAAPGAAPALEFYERDHQADLDDYLSGVTDWAQLVKAAFNRPESDLEGHRAVIQSARAAHRPAAAANAPRRYATLARREGYERLAALSPEQRRLFALPLATPSPRYRAAFFSEMGVDPTDPKTSAEDLGRIDAAFRAQTLWDATMAESLAHLIDAGARPAVLVVGRFHIEFDGGLVQQFRAQRPAASTLTIGLHVTIPAPAGAPAEDEGRADIVVYAPRQ